MANTVAVKVAEAGLRGVSTAASAPAAGATTAPTSSSDVKAVIGRVHILLMPALLVTLP